MLVRLSRSLLLLAVFVVGATTAREARAQNAAHPFGVGFQLGDPNALTAKVFLAGDSRYAVQFGLGSRGGYRDGPFYDYNGPLVTADVVYRFAGTQAGGGLKLGFYAGIGAGFSYASDCYRDAWGRTYCDADGTNMALFARVPVGLALYFPSAPIEIFLEIAPGFAIEPGFYATGTGGLGFRFYF